MFGALNRWAEGKFEKRLLTSAGRKSPVTVEVSAQASDRYGIYVNGDCIWVDVKQFLAMAKAREIVKRLEANGFKTLSAFS